MTHTSTGSTRSERAEKPEAMALSEARKLPMFADNPEALENLLQCPGMSFTCPYMKIDMVYVPKYTQNHTESFERVKSHIKKATAEKVAPKPKAAAAIADKVKKEPKEPKAKALPKRTIFRAQHLINEAKENFT
eukprot:7746806-Pyramimonas_sp.AAC.1